MNTQDFSAAAFDQTSSPVFSEALSRRLQREVEAELAPLIAKVMTKVVNELNQAGHALAPYGEQLPTELHYRSPKGQENYRLLLACDVVVTVDHRGAHAT